MSQHQFAPDHEATRDRLLPAAIGTDCPLCGYVMKIGQALDLDHVIPRSEGGATGPVRITHSYCNRSRGGRHEDVTGRKTRECVICGTEYVGTYRGQRACSRTCGIALKRRNHVARPRPAYVPPPMPQTPGACSECGTTLPTGHRVTCSPTCDTQRKRTRSRMAYRLAVGIPIDAPLSSRGRPRTRTDVTGFLGEHTSRPASSRASLPERVVSRLEELP